MVLNYMLILLISNEIFANYHVAKFECLLSHILRDSLCLLVLKALIYH